MNAKFYKFEKVPSHWLALADQVLVSGSNFTVGIILARTFGVQLFGVYVIATTFLLYANTFQSSLVVSSMMTAIPHEVDEEKKQILLSGFLGYAISLSFVCAIGIALISNLLGSLFPSLQLGINLWPLMLAIFGFQLQDWLRRALYAQQKVQGVLVLDSMAYGSQMLCLGLLYLENSITPSTALFSTAGAFFFSALLMLVVYKISPSLKFALYVIKTYWKGSRDYFAAWQLQWIGSQGVILVGGGALGQEIVGAIRAIQNLTGPMNIIFQWMENVIPVRAIAHLKNSGMSGMYHFLGKVGKLGGAMLGLVVLVMYFYAEVIVVFLYGEAYRAYSFYAVLQGMYFWLGHFYRMELYACRALEKSIDVARASLIIALASPIVTLLLVKSLGGVGIMLALIFGQTTSYLFLLYRRKLFKAV